jgi:DNA modification methylase
VIINANAAHLPLSSETFHAVVTSPPYWGLRNYGVRPTVWGGDTGCNHNWEHQRWYTERTAGVKSSDAFSRPGESNAARVKAARWREADTCLKCGAWRGVLGLEPTVRMYVEHLVLVCREIRRVLRSDGTFWLNLGDSHGGGGSNHRDPVRGRRNSAMNRCRSTPRIIPAPALNRKTSACDT